METCVNAMDCISAAKKTKKNELRKVNGFRLMEQILMKNISTGKLSLLIHIV